MVTATRLQLNRYSNVVVLTGAGISVASGLRPFRGPGGLWEEDESAAPLDAAQLARDPRSVWAFFKELRSHVERAEPNAAHLALACAEANFSGNSFTLVTQNVDGLHRAAGSSNVIELHGAVERDRCSGCEARTPASAADEPPTCAVCGALLRPDVVLFDEPIAVDDEWAVKRALRECDLFLAVGTSGSVTPASNFVRAAEYAGARTIVVNLEKMPIPNPAFQEEILGRAEDVLPALLADASDPG
jgi:NAD-dependent deacetylase